MSDYDKYLQALATEASDNVYTNFGGLADSLSSAPIDYVKQPGADIGEAMLYSSILGMLGGGLGEIGRSKAADEVNLASKVLMGSVDGRPDGLSDSLYTKSLTYRDLMKKQQADDIAEELRKERLGITSQMIKDINKKDIDIGNIGREFEANEAAKRGGLVSGITDKGRDAPEIQMAPSPLLQAIAQKVPSYMQEKAIAEAGVMDSLDDAFKQVDDNIDTAYRSATTIGSLDPTGKSPSYTEAARIYDTAKANLTANVLRIWKGPLDENDARRIVEPFIPNKLDTPESKARKAQGLKNLLAGNATPTPILQLYGIRDRPSTDVQSPGGGGDVRQYIRNAIKAGMSPDQAKAAWQSGKPLTMSNSPLG